MITCDFNIKLPPDVVEHLIGINGEVLNRQLHCSRVGGIIYSQTVIFDNVILMFFSESVIISNTCEFCQIVNQFRCSL